MKNNCKKVKVKVNLKLKSKFKILEIFLIKKIFIEIYYNKYISYYFPIVVLIITTHCNPPVLLFM